MAIPMVKKKMLGIKPTQRVLWKRSRFVDKNLQFILLKIPSLLPSLPNIICMKLFMSWPNFAILSKDTPTFSNKISYDASRLSILSSN